MTTPGKTTPRNAEAEARLSDALHGLRRDLDNNVAVLRDKRAPLLAMLAREDELARYCRDLDAQLERVSDAAVITLVGATGAGKSTLLNALVGQAIATPGTSRPTTTRPVIYRPRNTDTSALVEGLEGYEPHIVDYTAGQSGNLFSEQVIIDAPDTNSTSTEHHEVVRKLAERSDVLVVVAHRQSVAELASIEFVDAFAGRRDLILVLNRADELSDEARAELLSQLRKLANERWLGTSGEAPRVIATSAARALECDAQDVPGWSELQQQLGALVTSGRLGSVRRHNALGTVERVAQLSSELRAQLDSDFLQLERDGALALAAFRTRVGEELDERLALRRDDLKHLLWQETSRHWDGPGGWALKTGGLAGLGFGAGAAVMRRNPLLAVGTAAGALALDRAGGALREQRLERTSGLVPTDLELDGWYREEFAKARLLSQKLTGNPEAFELASSETASARATGSIEAAWARLLERDLQAAAGRGSKWYLRLPIDLPVYALVGWVVWLAGLGLFGGFFGAQADSTAGAGSSLLINAALVLFAWLFLARGAVRLLLGGLVSSLLARVRLSALIELERMQTEYGAQHASGIAARRDALERLAHLDDTWRARLHGTQSK